ncbi:SPFH domain-containing protein [Phycisphaerales bacterium AB-hyl4]|uniref:SPFH domain-containing protein n=1 Tax=Natronomicrosphaera hydrolytica TaxID=3242702 RepID=A0ABV4U3I5_9BACT
MSQDQQTYSRAANAALVGLLAQLTLAIGMALLGLYADAPALHAATWYLFGGLPIWITLLVLYHQHRLERVEALEAEQLAKADARTAALFEEAGQQLQLARKRLENLYRFGLPTISVLIATYLLAVGGTLLYLNIQAYQRGELWATAMRSDASASGVALIALVIGFAAFLVARYVAGMTQVRDWQLLRGGAAYLMGNAVAAIAITAAGGLAVFGGLGGLVWLAMIVPGVMLLLGTEMLLGFTLGIYRPRRAGEVTRPAFDSRLLGWLTRPESLGKIVSETLNYQFGFEISSSWFYRLLAKAVTPLIVVGLVVLIGMTSLVFVAPQQEAVITTFGKFDRVVEPGLRFKWPWPVSRAEKFDAYRVHQVVVGSKPYLSDTSIAILWTNEHAPGEEEQFLLTAPTRVDDLELGTDSPVGELVGTEVVVNFRIGDLERFARNTPNPQQLYLAQRQMERWADGNRRAGEQRIDPSPIVTSLAERRVTRYYSMRTIDELLTEDRAVAGRLLREQIQSDLDERDLGVELVYVGIVGVHPPQEGDVAARFHEQIGVLQQNQIALEEAERDAIATLAAAAGSHDRARQINAAISDFENLRRRVQRMEGRDNADEDALADARQQVIEKEAEIEQLMNEAGGRAAQLIHEAQAYRWQHALAEVARAGRYAAQYEGYQYAPRYFMMRQYLDTLAEGLVDRRKFIMTAEQKSPSMIRIQLDDAQSGFDSLLGD